MIRLLLAVATLALAPLAAAAQDVSVTTLDAPDAFSTPGRETGLPSTLWKDAGFETAERTMTALATKPLSPAAQALARRVLATGAPGPRGAGMAPEAAAARTAALLAAGDARAAATILERTPSIDRSSALSRVAADAALLAGDDIRACAVEQGLAADRADIYWLRLRAYCQAQAREMSQAQLTFDLAQSQSRDAVFGRLMAVKINGTGDPGAASLRNPLDYALSRTLGLDLTATKPASVVASALNGGEPAPLVFDETLGPAEPLIIAAERADAKTKPLAQTRALLAAALEPSLTADLRGRLAAFASPAGKATAGALLALDDAAAAGLMGETAMLALSIAADAGAAGPAAGDRIRIVRALRLVGLEADARNFALEGA